MVYDGYRAHLRMKGLRLFSRNNIIVYDLPANTLGKTQPLEVVVFSAFKSAMQNI